MLVYRYENRDGVGPFSGGSCVYWADMPGPLTDGIDDHQVGEIFGCKDRRTLRKWFGRINRLGAKKAGFRLAIYEVPDRHVKVGGCQVAFNPKRAVKVVKRDRPDPPKFRSTSGTFTSTTSGTVVVLSVQ